jgi:transposase
MLCYYLLTVSYLVSTPLSETEQIIQLQKKLAWAELKIQVLEAQLRLQRIKKYGPGSEKLSDAQLSLLELEPGVSNVEVQAESVREPLPASTNRKPRPHPGRQELPATLARVERLIACAPEQCTCKACGQPTAVIGYDVSEHLDLEPAKYFVVVTKREKRACKHCQEGVPGSGADHRKGSGQRRGGDPHGGRKILRSFAAVPPERDSGTGSGRRDQPGDDGRMGDAGGRVTHSHRGSDAPGLTRRQLHSGR